MKQITSPVTVRPIRDTDVTALGRVHAQCWHETYDQLISAAAMENLSPRRMAELWSHMASRGSEYHQYAALLDGEIIGFVGSGPARDPNPPHKLELYFIYVLDEHHGGGTGQQLLDAAIGNEPAYLWVAAGSSRAHSFYERNGFRLDGATQREPFLGEEIDEIRYVRS